MERLVCDTQGRLHQVEYEVETESWQVDGHQATAVPEFLTDKEREQKLDALAIRASGRGALTWQVFVFQAADLERLQRDALVEL